jgi:diaminohydroxyphosphoribosylaminopyrimidine deaminase/5-amino-6-(5-phosphoribosylamino)uracil reductase
MVQRFDNLESVMRRALELAALGVGYVEPNPPVGAVVVDGNLNLLGSGYHKKFGGPHAEIHALNSAGDQARGSTLFVTLEPCCHQGKTGPCSQAIIQAGVKKVYVAIQDPAPHVDGGGLQDLNQAGIEVEVGLLEAEANRLAAPFIKKMTTGLPYIHAKWAMTLDGKIASKSGSSQWISNEASRAVVHQLRGRMDAIVVGSTTAEKDDPTLTARPAGPRTSIRIVVDSQAKLSLNSKLIQTIDESPVLLATTAGADEERVKKLQSAGVEVLQLPATKNDDGRVPLMPLLLELGNRGVTNVLVEGGGELLGGFFDARLIDEAHVFVAAKLIGGKTAQTPLAGLGIADMESAVEIDQPEIEILGTDIYCRGPLNYT